MGDPRKTRRKYSSPSHPWEKTRIEHESQLIASYSLKNKKEIWKMNSLLKGFKHQAKKLGSLNTKQSEKEKQQLLARLVSYNLLTQENMGMEVILNLKLEDIMERRLQTLTFKKGLARSVKQARQFITHGHISVGGKVITSPSYIVLGKEEGMLSFHQHSAIASADHPERQIAKPVEVKADGEKNTKATHKE
ncbi:30S ribosomal protein S4 [Candidatus Woesearchaeota archaeon]|nr:30S ribosomal protein S4 [Candidatus Woesearchaeota archaeon]